MSKTKQTILVEVFYGPTDHHNAYLDLNRRESFDRFTSTIADLMTYKGYRIITSNVLDRSNFISVNIKSSKLRGYENYLNIIVSARTTNNELKTDGNKSTSFSVIINNKVFFDYQKAMEHISMNI